VVKLTGKYDITNKDQLQGIVEETPTFFGKDVKDYGRVLDAGYWRICYSEGTIYIRFEEIEPGTFNPLTWSHKYKREFVVESKEESGAWEAKTITTKIGEAPKESKEKFTEELNRLLKTKVGSGWLERQKARLYSL